MLNAPVATHGRPNGPGVAMNEASDDRDLLVYMSKVDSVLSTSSMDSYSKHVKQVIAHLRAPDGSLDINNIADDLRAHRINRGWGDSMMRTCRSAFRYWLASRAAEAQASGKSISEYAAAFNAVTNLTPRTTPGQPARLRRKSENSKTFLAKHLVAMKTRFEEKLNTELVCDYTDAAYLFASTNLLVGLRPIEWFSARLITTEKPYRLIVQNAKWSHGRANGESRELLLHGIEDQQLKSIIMLLRLVQRYSQEDDRLARFGIGKVSGMFFKRLRDAMSRSFKKAAVTNPPALYNTRHQCIANAKASGLSSVEIAAFFGHVSTTTQSRHYSHKRNGTAGFMFRPSTESIQNVGVKHFAVKQLNDIAKEAEQTMQALREGRPAG